MIKRIDIRKPPKEFRQWLDKLKLDGYNYEIVVERYKVNHVYIYKPDNGEWEDVRFGRIVGGSNSAYKQIVVKPAIVDNVFKENIDVKWHANKE